MRVLKREWLTGLGLVAVLVTLSGASALAQNGAAEFGMSTDRPGSIVLFPKVIADGRNGLASSISYVLRSFSPVMVAAAKLGAISEAKTYCPKKNMFTSPCACSAFASKRVSWGQAKYTTIANNA